jgi:hypothetical protein
VRRVGLPGLRLHDLRHAYATRLLEASVHPKVVSEALGHSSVSFTMDTYQHLMPIMQESAVRPLSPLWAGLSGLSDGTGLGRHRPDFSASLRGRNVKCDRLIGEDGPDFQMATKNIYVAPKCRQVDILLVLDA